MKSSKLWKVSRHIYPLLSELVNKKLACLTVCVIPRLPDDGGFCFLINIPRNEAKLEKTWYFYDVNKRKSAISCSDWVFGKTFAKEIT